MADTNHSRRDDHASFSENDPFAELTRIMGHDPRAAAPVQQPSEDSFDIDLEKELMGDLDFSDFDDPQPEAAQEQPEPVHQASSWAPIEEPQVSYEAEASEKEPELSDDFLSEFEAAFEDDAEPAADREPAAFAEPVSFEPEPEMLGQEPSYAGSSSEALSMDDLIAELEEPADHLPVEQFDTVAPQPESRAVVEEPAAAHWRQEAAAPASHDDDEDEMAEVDMDFGFLEEELTGAPETSHEPAIAYEAEAHVEEPDQVEDVPMGHVFFAPADEQDASAASTGPAELSLEDELSALLSDEPAADVPVSPSVEPTTRAAADDWHPAVTTFGRSNFVAPRNEEAVFEPAQPEYEAEEASFEAEEPAFEEPEHILEEPVSATEEEVAPIAMLGDDDFADIFGEEAVAFAEEPAQPAMQQSHAAGVDALASWQPERSWQQPKPVAQPAPDIETVEVSDTVVAMTDDLDIPDVDYGAADVSTGFYDDLEGEIAQAFGDVAADEPEATTSQPNIGWGTAAVAAGAAAYGTHAASVAAAPAAHSAGGHDQPAQPADAYAVGEGQWQADGQYLDDGFDYETDLEQAIAMSSYEEEEDNRPAGRKRGLLIAAVVAGVAVVGGVGVFGMSMFGGGSDSPAVVRADADPMKVRPENPGGTTVPNQDNQVYQRVSGGASDAAPQQESLISTAEEPIDMAATADEQATLPPGITDEGDVPATVDDLVAGLPKAEDRIEPVAEPEGVGASDDVAAVAPRRVRTMVVRADGTMVPREEAAPAAEQTPESVLAAATIAAAPALAPANSAPQAGLVPSEEAAQAEDDGGPVVNTPATVAVVPSQRMDPQTAPQAQSPAAAPVVAQAAVQQQPASQLPAATPVSAPAAAPAAASGAWSMQIASQPTAEGAQSTYQDLARRYGGVLEGRGVNIVRADIEGMGTYYRVRIPAETRDEAIQLCTRYKSAGGSCFVSR
ncbi:hypothetical protein FY036_16325 [Mesorhizobium microcysteis]|uniref:SPOR domain-containing protein n=1 Tax=Neoaquamicrobium microcysteis TaxID=2682781 RepID=A0A5D4GQ55_9HYPH|nr:SPOR domain-containing protein [Mesorhizobium microcysteis]TYR31001.1 hypothetical protein FY036_16325 [Mesorhizobium microcysteis]